MDYLTKRIQEKLLARGRAEQARADEWRRSLKPTVYRGNNLFQEMGGEPLEGRYLGQQGLIPGQSVPNIGRNPNKPVIPGLPVLAETFEEEVFVIEKIWFSQNYERGLLVNSGAALATVFAIGDPVLNNTAPITGIGSVESSYTGGLSIDPERSFGKFVKTKAFSISFKFKTLDGRTPNPLLGTSPELFDPNGSIDFVLDLVYVPLLGEEFLSLNVFVRTDTVTQFRSANFLPQNLNDGNVHTVELTRRNGVYVFSVDGFSDTATVDNFNYSQRSEDSDKWGVLLSESSYGSAIVDDVLIKLL